MRIVVMMAALLGSAVAMAGPPDGRPAPIERLTQELGLDDTQVVQVGQILEAKRERMQALRELDKADRRAEKKLVHEDTRLQLQSVLSEAQLQKLDELHEQRRGRRGRGGDDRSGNDGDSV